MYKTTIEQPRAVSESSMFPADVEDKAHFYQSTAWYDTHPSSYKIACTYEGEQLLARSLISEVSLPIGLGKVYKIERGPHAVNCEALFAHLDQLLETLESGVMMQISPYSDSSEDIRKIDDYLLSKGWKSVVETRNYYKNTVIVDLNPSVEELRRGLRKSYKSCLNKGARLGLESIVNPNTETVDSIVAQYNRFASERTLQKISDQDAHFIHSGIASGKVVVLAVILEDELLGGNIMMSYGGNLVCDWGVYSTREEHRKIPIGHFADWESILWAKENGYKTFDLCGYWLDRGDEDPINKYKTGFSKTIIPITPEYDYYMNPVVANLAIKARDTYRRLQRL